MSTLSLQCPSCGRQNDELEKQCECGFQGLSSYITELEKKGINAVKNKSLILLECPSCGRQNIDLEKKCECGFSDESIIAKLEKKNSNAVNNKSLKNIDTPKNNEDTKNILIKEVDSWVFTFSHEEKCINLGTPDLKAFKLTLTLEDLEEVLEFVYRFTGRQKTIRKIQLPVDAMPELIEEVHRLIEEKRSKVSIEFDKDELQGISELINKKFNK